METKSERVENFRTFQIYELLTILTNLIPIIAYDNMSFDYFEYRHVLKLPYI